MRTVRGCTQFEVSKGEEEKRDSLIRREQFSNLTGRSPPPQLQDPDPMIPGPGIPYAWP